MNSIFKMTDYDRLTESFAQACRKADESHISLGAINGNTPPAYQKNRLILECLRDIEPEAISWIWPSRIARSKITLVAGDPGLGKSQIATDIASRITRGARWPDGGDAPLGSVVVLNAEDGTNDTLRPRFEAAGADLNRAHVLRSVVESQKRRPFNLQRDLEALGKKIATIGDVALVTIDPITAYMGKVDGHQATEVRAVLEPVADFAQRCKVAVLGITHPPKNAPAKAINAFTGSLAYVAIARTVFLAIEEPETDRRLLVPVKNNLAALAPGIGYRLAQTIIGNNIVASHVIWDSAPVTVTANEALAAAADIASRGAMAEAKEFLREELSEGPVEVAALLARAEAAHIAERTLRRAKAALRVVATKKGEIAGPWSWQLPTK
jgi:hypothetical protein